jgi:hypothetical protein
MIKKLWIIIILLIILIPGCKVNREVSGYEPAPVLISPENGSIVSENPPTFTWHGVNDNSHYEIYLTTEDNYIDNESRYTRMVYAGFGATTVSYTYDIVLPSGVYTWSVRWVKDVNT